MDRGHALQNHAISLDGESDPLEVAEVPPDQECLTNDITFWDESPITTIATTVSVIAHREVIPGRHRAGEFGVLIDAVLLEWELMYSGEMQTRDVRIDDDVMTPLAQ
jgi:hypothetical protein